MPTLIINKSGDPDPAVVSTVDNPVTIGRTKSNVVRLGTAGVSRNHAQILLEGENFFLVDVGSGNGTFLNGVALRPNQKSILQKGDVINIDEYELRFHPQNELTYRPDAEEVTESDILEIKLLKKVLGAMDKETVPSIEVLNGSCEGKKFLFTDEVTEITIGRDPECDFPVNEYVVSRQHVRISKRWGGIAIRDLESKNGTFLNNRRVVEEYLHDGDRIALGTIVLIFRNPQEINFANIEDIKPKRKPAETPPEEIPGAVDAEPPPEEILEEQAEPEPEPEAKSEEEDFEREVQMAESAAENYPKPAPRVEKIKTITPMEIGLLGLGGLVILLAVITMINLISS